MSEIKTRVVREQRMEIGADGAWVSRDGNEIKISYDYAGRVTKETQLFYADDIRKLARFVEATEVAAQSPSGDE